MWEKGSATISLMLEVANDALVLQLYQFMLLLKQPSIPIKFSWG